METGLVLKHIKNLIWDNRADINTCMQQYYGNGLEAVYLGDQRIVPQGIAVCVMEANSNTKWGATRAHDVTYNVDIRCQARHTDKEAIWTMISDFGDAVQRLVNTPSNLSFLEEEDDRSVNIYASLTGPRTRPVVVGSLIVCQMSWTGFEWIGDQNYLSED